MADEAVRQVQHWLNSHYNFQVSEDGYTGGITVNALKKALQIELGLEADGSFGTGTANAFNNMFPNGLNSETNPTEQNKKNIIYILRSGMYCRGIDGGSIAEADEESYKFTANLELAITNMKLQLGINNPSTMTTAREMKAVLTTDAYTLVSSGDASIREIQQALNRKYLSILGDYLATNGLYERNTNKAIKMAIQSEIGVTPDGSWGNGTKNALPALSYGSTRTNLIYLLQYLLYLNGFNPNGFDGSFGNGARTAVRNFQTLMYLEVDGSVGPQTWFALVLSSGDTSRSANACDTRFEITANRAQVLKNAGYQVVGRYINGGDFKELRNGELETIFNAGLKVFFIYQENNRLISDFSYSKGFEIGITASECAKSHKLPKNSVIYFAVDLDVYADQIDEYIIPFFKGINTTLNKDYKVGIYGPRLVCSKVSEARLSNSSFVADMSTGYSCNIGQKMPNDWCYDQFNEISNFNNDFDIDKVTYNGRIQATDHVEEPTDQVTKLRNQLKYLYDLTSQYSDQKNKNWNIIEKNKNVMDYLRNVSSYNNIMWEQFAGKIDDNYIQYLEQNLIDGMRRSDIKLPSQKYGNMNVEHLAASTSALLHHFIVFDKETNDLTGWAGDLLQLGGKLETKKNIHLFSNEDVYKLIGCDEDDFAISLGFKNANEPGFGWEDLEQDIDAVNISNLLKSNLEIYKVFATYYGSTVYNLRIQVFISLIGVSEVTEEAIKAKAKEYTDLTKASAIAFCLYFGNYSASDFSDKLSGQFAKKIITMYNE